MEASFIENALTQGIWAGTAVFLIMHFIKSSERREERHEEQELRLFSIIAELTENIRQIENKLQEWMEKKKEQSTMDTGNMT